MESIAKFWAPFTHVCDGFISVWDCVRIDELFRSITFLNCTLNNFKRHTAQWSSSLGRGWQNCSIKFRRLSKGYALAYAIRIKAHICRAIFLFWHRDPLYYQISLNFFIFDHCFGLLKLIQAGYSCFKYVLKPFSAQNISKSFQKELNLLQSV